VPGTNITAFLPGGDGSNTQGEEGASSDSQADSSTTFGESKIDDDSGSQDVHQGPGDYSNHRSEGDHDSYDSKTHTNSPTGVSGFNVHDEDNDQSESYVHDEGGMRDSTSTKSDDDVFNVDMNSTNRGMDIDSSKESKENKEEHTGNGVYDYHEETDSKGTISIQIGGNGNAFNAADQALDEMKNAGGGLSGSGKAMQKRGIIDPTVNVMDISKEVDNISYKVGFAIDAGCHGYDNGYSGDWGQCCYDKVQMPARRKNRDFYLECLWGKEEISMPRYRERQLMDEQIEPVSESVGKEAERCDTLAAGPALCCRAKIETRERRMDDAFFPKCVEESWKLFPTPLKRDLAEIEDGVSGQIVLDGAVSEDMAIIHTAEEEQTVLLDCVPGKPGCAQQQRSLREYGHDLATCMAGRNGSAGGPCEMLGDIPATQGLAVVGLVALGFVAVSVILMALKGCCTLRRPVLGVALEEDTEVMVVRVERYSDCA